MATNPSHVEKLRTTLTGEKLDGFIVPLTDEHMSEYVGSYAQRLKWLTGFDGSAGAAAVLATKAAIFVDGRYTIQVKGEVDNNVFTHKRLEDDGLLQWLFDESETGSIIGYDPELATVDWLEKAKDYLAPKSIKLTAVSRNPIDATWSEQPEPSLAPVFPHDVLYTGKTAEDKRAEIAASLQRKGADCAVITMLDSVAWAFNIRGSDVHRTPVPHAFAILNSDESAVLYMDERKVTSDLRHHLGNNVQLKSRAEFYTDLAGLGARGSSVLVDRTTNNAKVIGTLKDAGATLVEGQDPCILAKAIKNPVETQGSRDAHIRDGAVITEFLRWLDEEAPKGTVDELSAAAKLWSLRETGDLIKDCSFDTISAAGPNAALAHYRVSEATNRKLAMNSIYLVDSGGQYLDGTTDITRTIIVGTPTDEMKDRFTRVLKGHIALSTALYPTGTTGSALDALARKPLWDVGLDYDHGTGHGVGSYLAVHEGPQRIAKAPNSIALKPGMILSNEPGFYKAGEYGIRIENLVVVREMDAPGDRDMLGFENLTWAPIDTRLVNTELLTEAEKDWLNSYHMQVREKIGPLVNGKTADWLEAATMPV